jgi:hypothetical protein
MNAPLLDTDALRRAALARSAQRSHQVARRRLAWRWSLFIALKLLRWGAALLGVGLILLLLWALTTGRPPLRAIAQLLAPLAPDWLSPLL